ncbi:uncharacterized protein [Hyperolius riggenbachi]|uniref:uncharacterized protein isoform X3 n=1 Tax=Hyperolius riggenbachi TaxID=752182 RepID=UPI0035A38F79
MAYNFIDSLEQNWNEKLNEVFQREEEIRTETLPEDFTSLCGQIKDTHIHYVKVWWNINSLERYDKEGIYPRGIRVQIFPSWQLEDRHKKIWESGLNRCARIIVQMLISLDRELLTKLKLKSLDLLQQISKYDQKSLVEPFLERLKSDIKHIETDVVEIKKKKLLRDRRDYAESKAYIWRHKNNRRGQNFPKPPYKPKRKPKKPVPNPQVPSGQGGVGRLPRDYISDSSDFGESDFESSALNHLGRLEELRQIGKKHKGNSDNSGQQNDQVLSIINLSDIQLTETEENLLRRGLTFSPTNRFDTFEIIKDLYFFCRRLMLKKIYHTSDDLVPPSLDALGLDEQDKNIFSDLISLLEEQNTQVGVSQSPFRPASKFLPSFNTCPQVQVFFDVVSSEVQQIANTNEREFDNLTRQERKALGDLSRRTDIIIREADKGGNVVIWPREQYEREVYRQLNNTDFYRKLSGNPTECFQRELRLLLEEGLSEQFITNKEFKYLWVETPITPTFYILPKVHKDKSNPPGRPIVSGIGGLSEKCCSFIDFFLQPHVVSLDSYVRDSTDILTKIQDVQMGPEDILATCDVESLYSNISHDHGIRAVKYFLDAETIENKRRNSWLLQLLEYILKHNFFLFNNTFYLQIRGVAMGAKCAPSVANLFLGWWERECVWVPSLERFHPAIAGWHRFIDDILILWQGSQEDLKQFLTLLNTNDVNIFLTSDISSTTVNFLDLHIMKDEEGHLISTLYRKKTAVNSLLHFSSYHTPTTRRNIPVGQFLRLRRNCSTPQAFEEEAGKLACRFRERGYPNKYVRKAWRRARFTNRETLLQPSTIQKEKIRGDQVVRLTTRYNDRWNEIYKIVQSHWGILQSDPILKQYLAKKASITAKRAPTLRDQLCHSHYMLPIRSLSVKGSHPCGHCSICDLMPPTKFIINHRDDKRVYLQDFINCQTPWVIYMLECICGKRYVGQTQKPLKIRIQKHRSTIKLAPRDNLEGKLLTTVAAHSLLCTPGNMDRWRVYGVKKLFLNNRGGNHTIKLLQLELQWIHRLGTRCPTGLNEEFGFGCFLPP